MASEIKPHPKFKKILAGGTYGTGIMSRDKAYKEVLRATRNPHLATRAYCAGNKWLTENASCWELVTN